MSLCATAAAQSPVPAPVDVAVTPALRDLLALAFDAASAMPTDPHAKNRARAQSVVIGGCLQLGQAALANEWIARMEGWRRGDRLADLALHCIEHGSAAAAPPLLESALAFATGLAGDQEWRRDRIRSKVARAWLSLGDEGRAKANAIGIVDSELGPVEIAVAQQLAATDFKAWLAQFDKVAAAGSFDQTLAGLQACVHRFDAVFDDAACRAELEQRVRTAGAKVPIQARLEMVVQLVAIAVRRGDAPTATRLAEESRLLMQQVTWLPEDEIAWSGRLAGLRARAGDAAKGRAAADAALARYHECRDRIVDVQRAGALRPVAEAFVAAGAPARAAATFRLAVDEGATNPNARPRAEDLVATCVAIAVCGLPPDAGLRARLDAVREGLRQPW